MLKEITISYKKKMPVEGVNYSSQEAMYFETHSFENGEEATDELVDKLKNKAKTEVEMMITNQPRWLCEDQISKRQRPLKVPKVKKEK